MEQNRRENDDAIKRIGGRGEQAEEQIRDWPTRRVGGSGDDEDQAVGGTGGSGTGGSGRPPED